MKNLNVIVDESTSLVYPDKKTIGNEYENLQGNIVFKFKKEFINGIGWLEMKLPDGTTGFLNLTKENEEYSLPIKSSLLKNQGKIFMQLRITEDENENGIPVFKSNIFYVEVKESLNVTDEIPDQYQSWIDIANEKLLEFEKAITEVENIDINAERIETGVEIEITDKKGQTKKVVVNDGYTPKKGIDYFTNEEVNSIINSAKYDDTEIKQDINNIDIELEGITGNINNIANDVEKNKQDILELEENQNYLEETKANKIDLKGFIKNTVNDLVYYYKKSETYTQTEVNQLIGAIKTISMKLVPVRPETGEANIIYLVPSKKIEQENIYDEWIYVNNQWELIGTTQIDLSNYYTKKQINTLLYDYITSNDLEDILENYALKSDIPVIKVDENTIKKDNENKLQSVGSVLKNGGFQNYWSGTKNEFNSIIEKDANTLYEILDDEETALFEVDGNTLEFSEDGLLRIPNNMDMMYQSITYGNHESGYRKWRNGYLEQWGVATSNANGDYEFTMHQSHIDTNFSVFIEPREQGNFFHYAIPSAKQKFRTRIQTRDSANIAVKFQWHSYGYWK